MSSTYYLTSQGLILALDHLFIDENKRTALAPALTFLKINGHSALGEEPTSKRRSNSRKVGPTAYS